MKPYIMGEYTRNTWRQNEAQQLSFVVTQDCNLRCKYCYMVGKNNEHKMRFETAKKIIDYFVDHKDDLFDSDYLILDFIGGESLLEIELIDQIVDYFRLTTYQKRSVWFGHFRISLESNGILFDSEAVQKFLRKNKNLVAVGITIDGTKKKHDLQRVFPNGEGSYEMVEKNYKMAVQQGVTRDTKVTFGHEDLKYIKESIIHLWSMGIKNVPANIVYEDVWQEGDDQIYEEQLEALADYVIDQNLWNEYNTTLFSDTLGFKETDDKMDAAICGTGNMYCVDANGDIYNCVRFMDYSLNGKPSKKIGDIDQGVDLDRKRALSTLFQKYISEQKCIDCRVSMGCTYCAGNNYDASKTNTLFYRATAICEMHKARVRANNYFWAKLYNQYGISRDVPYHNEYFMYFILSGDCVGFCDFLTERTRNRMKPEDLLRGLEYAFQNFYQPVFVHSDDSEQWLEELLHSEQYGEALSRELRRHIVKHIMKYRTDSRLKNILYVVEQNTELSSVELQEPVILNIEAGSISSLAERVKAVLPYTVRVNLNILKVDNTFDVSVYEEQLRIVSDLLFEYWQKGEQKEVRQLTDRIFDRKMNNCFAGEKNITLAPDGKFYYCAAFYFNKDLSVDFEGSKELTALSKAPICDHCDAYQCNRCIYKNMMGTGELNTPTRIQCTMAHVERKCSRELLKRLTDEKVLVSDIYKIPSVDYQDPIKKVIYKKRAQ